MRTDFIETKSRSLIVWILLLVSQPALAVGVDPGLVTLNVGGQQYKVFAQQGSYNNLLAQINSTPWLNDPQLPYQISSAYLVRGYFPNTINGANELPFVVMNSGGTRMAVTEDDNGNQSQYNIPVFSLNQGLHYWLLSGGPDSINTYQSFLPNAQALGGLLNTLQTKTAIGLNYDCVVYDQKNICVSFAGSKSDGKDLDVTTGVLIIAHKPSRNFRFGGYIDQSFGSQTFGGLTAKKGNPGLGAFAVWSQNADGSGVQLRTAYNLGKVGIETTRDAIGTAEAGFGKSNIKSQGFSLQLSRDYPIDSTWTVRPYAGYRQTISQRAGYTEESSNAVTAPLTYRSLKQSTETLTVGTTFLYTLSAKTTMLFTAGVEHDLKNRMGHYVGTSSVIGDIDSINMSADKIKTRPTVAFGVNHDIDKTQRLGVSLTYRQEALASHSTTSTFLQYSAGF